MKRLIKKIVVCSGIISLGAHIQADIKQVHTLQEFASAIDANTFPKKPHLILFDIDNSLITAPDVVGHAFDKKFEDAVEAKIRAKHPGLSAEDFKKKFNYYRSIQWKSEEKRVIEPASIGLIKQLRAQGNIVLGFTNTAPGQFYFISNFPKLRAVALKGMGLDFGQPFKNVTFTEFGKKHFPILYQGVIYGNGWPKGDVLKVFLKHFNFVPGMIDKVILFDDTRKNHETVAAALKELDIPFEGYEYLFVKERFNDWKDERRETISDKNFERGLYQWDYLLKHRGWLSDTQADAMRFKEQKTQSAAQQLQCP
jgi:hypothetical protein